MGKITFRRVINVLRSYYVVASLPIAGSVCFFVGSFTFLPGGLVIPGLAGFSGSLRAQHIFGATAFIIGSVCYLVAPILDLYDLQFNLENLQLNPEAVNNPADRYEYLYKSTLLQIQRANAILYMLAGVCFTLGSFMFYPNRNSTLWYTHGDWLYVAGCLLSGTGALVALLTACQLHKTAEEQTKPYPDPLFCWHLTDEAAAVLSCAMYIAGNVIFVLGSLAFFPDVLKGAARYQDGLSEKVEDGAVAAFVLGSIVFFIGSSIDLGIVVRAGRRKLACTLEGSPVDTKLDECGAADEKVALATAEDGTGHASKGSGASTYGTIP